MGRFFKVSIRRLPIETIHKMATSKQEPYFIASDQLKKMRELCVLWAGLRPLLSGLAQMRFVLDTNIVISDLLELAKPHKVANYRTALQELMASATVIAYAPNYLKKEMDQRWPGVAADKGISSEVAAQLWEDYQSGLRFCEVVVDERRAHFKAQDPKDWPFLVLAEHIGAHAIVSKDRDISAMGGQAVTIDFCVILRDYSRHKTVEVAIQIGSVVLTSAAIGTIVLVVKVIQMVLAGIMRLPPLLQLIIVVGTIWALADDKRRTALVAMVRLWWSGLAQTLADPISRAFDNFGEAAALALKTSRHVDEKLGVRKRVALRILIRATLTGEPSSLSVREIERRVRMAGYSTKAQNLQAYIRRVLRQEPAFRQVAGDKWRLAQPPVLAV